MQVTQDRVHMLSPYPCIVGHGCSCSGMSLGHLHMISQLVPEGCMRCSCPETPQAHQPSGVFVSKGWPLHDKGAQNHTLYRLLMNRLWSVFLRDLVYSMSASWTRARGRCSRPLPQASLRRCGRYAVRACLLDAVVFSSLCRLS